MWVRINFNIYSKIWTEIHTFLAKSLATFLKFAVFQKDYKNLK